MQFCLQVLIFQFSVNFHVAQPYHEVAKDIETDTVCPATEYQGAYGSPLIQLCTDHVQAVYPLGAV